jgi:hypothetical protein
MSDEMSRYREQKEKLYAVEADIRGDLAAKKAALMNSLDNFINDLISEGIHTAFNETEIKETSYSDDFRRMHSDIGIQTGFNCEIKIRLYYDSGFLTELTK